jgi:hypothetical protein
MECMQNIAPCVSPLRHVVKHFIAHPEASDGRIAAVLPNRFTVLPGNVISNS